jgi:cysteine desulfurase
MGEEGKRLTAMRDRLRDGIVTGLDGVVENGHPRDRLPNTLNLSFRGVDGAALLVALHELAVSSGSACTSAEPRPSHVLQALGVPARLADATIRFSLGRPTTDAEISTAIDVVIREVGRLRARTPVP